MKTQKRSSSASQRVKNSKTQHCWQLDLRLLLSRTIRKLIYGVELTQAVVFCHGSKLMSCQTNAMFQQTNRGVAWNLGWESDSISYYLLRSSRLSFSSKEEALQFRRRICVHKFGISVGFKWITFSITKRNPHHNSFWWGSAQQWLWTEIIQ